MNLNAADRNRQQLRQVSGSDIFRRASQLMAANREALAAKTRQDRIIAKAAELADQ